jgi:hypothetical protein
LVVCGAAAGGANTKAATASNLLKKIRLSDRAVICPCFRRTRWPVRD